MECNKNQLLNNVREVNQAVKLVQESINKADGDLSQLSKEEIDYLIFLAGTISCDMHNISMIIEEDMSFMVEMVPGVNGKQLVCHDWMMWIMHASNQINRILLPFCR